MNSVILVVLCCGALAQQEPAQPKDERVTDERIQSAAALAGLSFSDAERALMLADVAEQLESYEQIRERSLANSVAPALLFQPLPPGFAAPDENKAAVFSDPGQVKRPERLEDVAFYSVGQLAYLIKSRQVTSTELTRMYLARLEKHGPKLECVITLTRELALAQAARADREIAAGGYRGPLHGMPYGAKDLLAVKGYKTTWGAVPYKDQVLEETATVISKLEAAGAVLVAKLTLGALAWGDVWYGGMTRNPWNLEQGSSGSSAGSASATSAGLVAFSIGTETWGSIVSPATRCGVTGLRPTFGRVSRAGAMALSWSMDKIGPICRTAEDCALVFDTIRGPDGRDLTVVDMPFAYRPQVALADLKIGYYKAAFDDDYPGREADQASLDVLRRLGADLQPMDLPDLPVSAMAFILTAEAGAAFDELTRSGKDDLLVRQIKNAWPNVFRVSRTIPAVEYLQANRLRSQLILAMAATMKDLDLYLAPSFGRGNLLLTNLTGHPCVVVPNGFIDERSPKSISFIGKLHGEARLLAVARAYQEAAGFKDRHPPQFLPEQ